MRYTKPISMSGWVAAMTLATAFSMIFPVSRALAEDAPAAGTATAAAEKPADPFAFADFTWVPGGYAPLESKLATKYFTPEIRLDTVYNWEFSNPKDDTISGSSEVFRHREFQVTQVGVGGDFNYENVGFRLMTQFGMYSSTTPRNDASTSRGQWQLANAYRYISEAYGTYHIDSMNGINISAGIFMSYIGLFSYYNFDNWTYQPSYVSSNTPWFFNGARVQIFPSDKLKIEPWIINGWQSYGTFNNQPGLGAQILWRPTGTWSVLGNQYYGSDSSGNPDRRRFHTDDSVMTKYYEKESRGISQAAASLTIDYGCESGPTTGGPSANCGNNSFWGVMAYNRVWVDNNHWGFTVGGGAIRNPGRYLVLMPPINGATATGSPYFTENQGDKFWAWDTQLTTDWMPTRNIIFRLEFNHRWASVPYFAGHNGMTPPSGSTTDPVTGLVTTANGALWTPDLTKIENRLSLAMLVRL